MAANAPHRTSTHASLVSQAHNRVRGEVRRSVVYNAEHSRAVLADGSNTGRFGNGHASDRVATPTADQRSRSSDLVGSHVSQPRNRQATTVVVEEVLHGKGRMRKLAIFGKVIATPNEPRQTLFVTYRAGRV